MFDRRLLKNFDLVLFFSMLFLSILGILLIYSSSKMYVNKQLYWILVGLGLFVVTISIDYRALLKMNLFFFAGLLIFLIYLAFFASSGGGASRSVRMLGFSFQPAEFMKVSLLLLLSEIFSTAAKNKLTLRNLFIPGTIIILLMLLIFKQPDLGTALLYFVLFLAFIYMAGVSIKDIIFMLTPLFVLSPIIFYNLKPYQQNRIFTFLNPWKDVKGAGYNVIQSIIAVGSGGFSGKGFMAGTQSQLNFLPSKHTDFIFSVFAEQFGFIGVLLLFAVYFVFLYKIIAVLKNVKLAVEYYILSGIFMLFFLHIFINIGMAIGILPVTGLTLPFISYGGSDIIVFFIAIGIVENIRMRSNL